MQIPKNIRFLLAIPKNPVIINKEDGDSTGVTSLVLRNRGFLLVIRPRRGTISIRSLSKMELNLPNKGRMSPVIGAYYHLL
jgi:hypothetical protein